NYIFGIMFGLTANHFCCRFTSDLFGIRNKIRRYRRNGVAQVINAHLFIRVRIAAPLLPITSLGEYIAASYAGGVCSFHLVRPAASTEISLRTYDNGGAIGI